MSEELNLVDSEERKRIQEDLEKNILVEAGAGSGKTTSLVDRFVALVAGGGYEPGEIAAITFTRRAAAELKEKIQLEMEEMAAAPESTEKEERSLREALDNMDRFYLGTIHSFCARLLRERPVEFNIDPQFEQLDELAARQERKRAWQNYLVRARVEREELIDKLLQTDLNPMKLESSFNLLDGFPEVEVAVEELEKPDLSPAVRKAVKFVEEAIKFIPREEPEKGYDRLQRSVRQAWGYKEYTDLADDVNKFRLLKSFEGSLSVTLNRWLDGDRARKYRDERAPALQEDVIEPALRRWYRYRHKPAVDFLRPAVKQHRRLRREEAELNFQDLLHITARGLRKNPDLRRYFQNKYRSLLVDEFQDTDPLQAEIIFYLTGQNPEEKSWQQLTPKPGSLFLVGDPKQSIYRFRRADIDIYNLVRDRFQSGAGEVLNLTSNFRSLPAVTEPLNAVFESMLPAEESSYQAPFAPLNPVREGREEALSGVRVLEIPDRFTRKDEVVREDARRIAAIIEDAVRGGNKLAYSRPGLKDASLADPDYGDFMIILRYKDLLEEYVRALKEYDIPTDVSGGSTLDRSTVEVRELHKLVKLLQERNNPVLLTAVLRGLFYGLSDDELYQYRSAGGELDLRAEMPSGLEEKTEEKFEAAFKQLRRFCRLTEELTPAAALEKMIEELGLIPHLLADKSGENRLSSLYYLLERLKAAEAGRGIDFAGLVEEIDTVLEAGVEEELNLSYGTDAVRVMNLHKAKGLEAPVVFLAHPKKSTRHPPVRHIKREGDEPVGYFRFCQPGSYGSSETLALPPEWDKYAEEEKKYDEAEEKRLLYVAATRARNLLVISDCSRGKNSWQPLLDNLPARQKIEVPEVEKPVEMANESQAGGKDAGGKAPEPQDKAGMENREDILKLRDSLQDWQNKAVIPTYGAVSVTELIAGEESVGVSESEADERAREVAMAFGTAAHEMVERIIERRMDTDDIELNKLAERSAEVSGLEEEKIEEKADELTGIGNKFLSSDLWERICEADMVKTEVPFSLGAEPGEKLYEQIVDLEQKSEEAESPPEHDLAENDLNAYDTARETVRENEREIVYISGRIDLALKEKETWTIVDFKTGYSSGDESRAEDKYDNQLDIYRLAWEDLTSERTAEVMIYWLDG